MLAAWGDSTEDDKASEEEEVAVALMARSESDSDDEPLAVSYTHLTLPTKRIV